MIDKLKWASLALAFGGPVLAWQGWQAHSIWSRLEANGKTTEGVIEGGASSTSRGGSKNYSFDVTYTPEGQASMRETFVVSTAFVARVVVNHQIVQDKCTVRYDPTDPKIALIVDGSKDERDKLWIGIAMFVGGAAGAAVGFLHKKPGPQPVT
jgi:hypothetical protein